MTESWIILAYALAALLVGWIISSLLPLKWATALSILIIGQGLVATWIFEANNIANTFSTTEAVLHIIAGIIGVAVGLFLGQKQKSWRSLNYAIKTFIVASIAIVYFAIFL